MKQGCYNLRQCRHTIKRMSRRILYYRIYYSREIPILLFNNEIVTEPFSSRKIENLKDTTILIKLLDRSVFFSFFLLL